MYAMSFLLNILLGLGSAGLVCWLAVRVIAGC